MGLLEGIIGAVAGAIIGDHFGIAGGIGPFRPSNGAMNASVPFALTGLVIGGLLNNGSNNAQIPAKSGTQKIYNVEPPEYTQEIKNVEKAISDAFNYLRRCRNLEPCNVNLSIAMVARYKSLDVHKTGSLDSNSFGTVDNMLRDFGVRFGVGYGSVGVGYGEFGFSIYNWLSSTDQNELINNPRFNQIGVGYCKNDGVFTIIALEQ